MNVLVINCGSSSIKFSVYDSRFDPLFQGKRERLGVNSSEDSPSHQQAIEEIVQKVKRYPIEVVAHRIVHGGAEFSSPQIISEGVLQAIRHHASDAPMHNPYALAAIEICTEALPDAVHVGVFDTAFHARMPRRATTYAIDADVAQQFGIRRFGFHGISHEYAAGIAAEFLQRPINELRIITLHLGNGASACAVEYGHSTETSMGSTPLEGLVMGSRAGDVDAGVILTLLRAGYGVQELDTLLNQKSGLAGVSGLGNDLREIEDAAANGHDRARLAINVFAHRARKYIGAYAAAMGGVDAIVFTGGIGENSASMRSRILQRLEFLGVMLDEDGNRNAQVREDKDFAVITTPRSRIEAIVVKTNEELMMARQARATAKTVQSEQSHPIPIAVSARHCHLTAETFARLFGEDASPTPERDLSQPGQFACRERVNLIGPRNRIDGVRVLGPLRDVDQIEIARTDEFILGVDAPVRDSGNVKGSARITLEGPNGSVTLQEGLICARRHIHMHSRDAIRFAVKDRDEVSVSIIGGDRDLIFGDVLVRVNDNYQLEMHIDTDEANAAEIEGASTGGLSTDDIDDTYTLAGNASARLQN